MNKLLDKFEKIIIISLICMMGSVVLLSTIDLGMMIFKGIIQPPIALIEEENLLKIFAFFLYVLIGFELFETLRAYLKEKIFHLEILFEVALIALARKVILLDLEKYDSLTIIGFGCVTLAFAAAFYVIRLRGKRS